MKPVLHKHSKSETAGTFHSVWGILALGFFYLPLLYFSLLKFAWQWSRITMAYFCLLFSLGSVFMMYKAMGF